MVSMVLSLHIDGGNKRLQKSIMVMYKHRHKVASRIYEHVKGAIRRTSDEAATSASVVHVIATRNK